MVPPKKISKGMIGISCLVTLVICNYFLGYITPHIRTNEQFTISEMERAKESIALSLLGQVQFTVGSLMWLKTMEYLHNGVAYRPPTAAEQERGLREKDSFGLSEGLSHKEGVPIALTPKTDWRGIVGDIQREIVPYMTEHRHSDPKELIPWYKLATKFNPNLERLYVLGAFFMTDFAHEPDHAREYLLAGAKANPWSFEIYAALGRLYFESYNSYEDAITCLEKAVSLGKKERDRLTSLKQPLDDYQKQLFRESYLFWAKSLTELARYDEALQVCEDGIRETNFNLLNVQKRIIEKRRSGEQPIETAEISKKPHEGISYRQMDSVEEEDLIIQDYSEEDSESWFEILFVAKLAILVLGLVIMGTLIGIGYKKGRIRFTTMFNVLRQHPYLAGLLLIVSVLFSLGYYILTTKEKTFLDPKSEAVSKRDYITARTKKIAPWLVHTGDNLFEQAQTFEAEHDMEKATDAYRRAAAYYDRALYTANQYARKRRIQFPLSESLGTISIRPWHSSGTWEEMGEATGTVVIPSKHEVDLAVKGTIDQRKMLAISEVAPEIQSLNFGDTNLTDEQLFGLTNILGLRFMSFYGTRITDAAIEHLAKHAKAIEVLNLGKTAITDRAIEYLANFPRLKKVSLSETNITDKGLAYLQYIPSLRVLWLSGSNITNEGLKELSVLTNLRVLWLGNRGNYITDEGLKYLKQLTSLKELWIGSEAITEVGVNELRSILKECRILDKI